MDNSLVDQCRTHLQRCSYVSVVHLKMLVTLLSILVFLSIAQARIIVSVRGYRKILPHEKDSSYEDRVSPVHDYLHRAARLGYMAVSQTGINAKQEPRQYNPKESNNFIDGHNSEPLQQSLHRNIDIHGPEITQGAVAHPLNIQVSDEDDDDDMLYPPDSANFPFQLLDNDNSLKELSMRSSFHNKLQTTTLYNPSRPLKNEADDGGIFLYLLLVCSFFLMIFSFMVFTVRTVAWLVSRGRVPIIAKPRIVLRPVIEA